MKAFVTGVCLLICLFVNAQDSSRLRISLLTCTQGEELYATFGHSALRIIDSNSVTDIVYNYGTFNFNDKDFYLKFIRGQLRYMESVDDFQNFKFEYQMSNRGITEQVLDLTATEKIELRHALNENLREENKYYMYDFFLDNCTTRLRDMILKYSAPAPVLPAVMPVDFTFRNAIHQYLDNGNKHWSKLGIDLLLGAPTDAVMTPAQQQFLPDNMMLSLDRAKGRKIVSTHDQLYEINTLTDQKAGFTPLMLFSVVLFVFIGITFIRNNFSVNLLKALDFILFFSTGVLGIVLLFMWFGTDHSMTKDNYNLLWAWPVLIVYAFMMDSKRNAVRGFSKLFSVFLLLVLLLWYFLPQLMNNALLPVVILLMWRSAIRGFGRRSILRGV